MNSPVFVNTQQKSYATVWRTKKAKKSLTYLISEKETDSLEGLLATVNVVAQEEIVGLWREAAILKQTQ